MGASILVTILAFFPVGIAAIIFASQVESKYKQGDYEGAKSNSNIAKVLCIVGGAIAVPFYMLLISVFGISLFANTQLESQAVKAKQSEAKQYISSINRGQQAYYAEKGKFSDTIEGIGLGITPETNNYKYIIVSVDESKAIAAATAKFKDLKSYTGAVFLDKNSDRLETTTKAAICVTERSSQTPPNIPQLIGNDIQCSAGSVSLDSVQKGDSLKAQSELSTTTSPSVVSPPSTSGSTAPRTFLGKSQTGYELWADKNCIYVKGITQGDLARLNTDRRGFKEAVKAETGYKCVLFE